MTGSHLWLRRGTALTLLLLALCVPAVTYAQTGTIDANDERFEYAPPPNVGSVLVTLTGSFSDTLTFQYYDGTTWRTHPACFDTSDPDTVVTTSAAAGAYICMNSGYSKLGVLGDSSWSGAAASVVYRASAPNWTFGSVNLTGVTVTGGRLLGSVLIENPSAVVPVRNSAIVEGPYARGGSVTTIYPLVAGGCASTATPTANASDDTSQCFWLTRNGAQYIMPAAPCANPSSVVSVPIDIVTATTTEVVGTASGASTYIYVCSVNLVTAGANNVSLVEDDTDNCASPTAGMAGGVTAGEGWNFGANGGIALGNGAGIVAKSAAANRYVCLITSAPVQLSGTITYALGP